MPGVEPSKTQQIYLLLRDQIASGVIAHGAALPPEQSLAASHQVSRITVRRALAELEREGLVRRVQGAGTYATPRHEPKPVIADLSDMLANIVAMGKTTDVRLLAFGYDQAPPQIAAALRLAEGERVQRSIRVRLIDGKPFSYLTTHVPERVGITYSEAELASRPLLSLIERSGIGVAQATQEIGALLASPDVAQALGIDVGSALIALTRVAFDAEGRGIEHLFALYRPDRYALRMDLVRTDGANGKRWSPIANDAFTPHSEPRAAADETRQRKMRTAGRNGRER
jgi:GntR family transcriptional regulator